MPLHLHRSPSNAALWDAFLKAFLGALDDRPGPRFPTHAWLAHRIHRDLLLEAAEERGVAGWVGAPFSFLGDLPELLGIEGRPVGLLTRRRLLASLSAKVGRRHGIAAAQGEGAGIARGHVLDGLFNELLPEGVTAGHLRNALADVADDDFARRRNAWIVEAWEGYRAALAERGLYDPRAVPGLLADAVAAGRLLDATAGARTLHLYGLHTLRTRERMIGALASQDGVAVHAWLPAEDGLDEWEALAASTETLGEPVGTPRVQPVPDRDREMRFVAERVKRLLAGGGTVPHRIAVVARTGLDDTRAAHQALEAAGVPASARIRTPLSEVAALRFLLELLRGAADAWPYRALRNVVSSPYVDCEVEVWILDRLADERRIRGLDGWIEAVGAFAARVVEDDDPSEAQEALAERVERSREALGALAAEVRELAGARSEAEWIARTRRLLDPGILRFRPRLCREVHDRWDVVRLDQRGVLQLEQLLAEWSGLELSAEPIGVGDWHQLLVRLLEGHTLTLSTPLQRGVQVLEAHDAALTPFDHVLVVHANDGEFPRLSGGGGVLTDQERMRLRGRLPLSNRDLELRRERTLWRAVTGAPDVTVTYRTTDPAGQPLLPSLLAPEHDVKTELSRVWHLPGAPLGEGEWLLCRAGDLADGGDAGSVGAGRLAQAVVAAVAESDRAGHAAARGPADLAASPWSGHLRDPAVLARLERDFGPERVWSAGQLETYGKCPFVFLLERVLALAAVEQAEESTNALTFGAVAHEVLERFYERARPPLPDRVDERIDRLLAEVLEEVRARREASGEWLGVPVLWRQTFRKLGEAVRGYLEWELPVMAKKRHAPHETEFSFGFDDDRFELVHPDLDGRPVTLRLRGRIDRVDREEGRDGPVHHVIDYKSGGVPAASGYEDGGTLQAALYLSVYAEAKGVRCGKSGYRSIKSPSGADSQRAVTWESDKHRAALSVAASIPRRVRAGHFEPVQAKSAGWAPWSPGIEITRGRACLSEGSRFEANLDREADGA